MGMLSMGIPIAQVRQALIMEGKYPDYETSWLEAGCKNTLPFPYNNLADRPNYPTQLECCIAAYSGQVSGQCLSELPIDPNAPTTADFWYADHTKPWTDAGCKN